MKSSFMKQFLPEELIQFLQKTDEFLTADCEVIVIGGAAATKLTSYDVVIQFVK